MLTYTYFDYPLDFTDILKEKVEQVTKADVLRVAKKYLHPSKVQILVVGNQKDFDKPLSSLGDVNVIDIKILTPAK
jgi:predicted Zn-dependent peptidase